MNFQILLLFFKNCSTRLKSVKKIKYFLLACATILVTYLNLRFVLCTCAKIGGIPVRILTLLELWVKSGTSLFVFSPPYGAERFALGEP